MPDSAYGQTGKGFAADLKRSREIQSDLAKDGESISRAEALALAREERKDAEAKEKEVLKALNEAKPAFLKDGLGIRGPQPDAAAKKMEIPGADGRGANGLHIHKGTIIAAAADAAEDGAAGPTYTAGDGISLAGDAIANTGVLSVSGSDGVTVDNTDPANPVVSLTDSATIAFHAIKVDGGSFTHVILTGILTESAP